MFYICNIVLLSLLRKIVNDNFICHNKA